MKKKFAILVLILFVGFLLFGCIGQPPSNIQPVEGVPLNNSVLNQTKTAKLGDIVSVDYTLKLENGSIIDTSIESVANESGIYNQNRKYSPLVFKLAYDSGLIKGFVDGVIGMKVNQTKSILVQPADGYGLVNNTKIYSVQLYYNRSKFENVSRASLEKKNVTIEKDNIFFTNIGMVAIEDFDNESVTIMYVLSPGKKFNYNGVPHRVVNVTNDTLYLKFDFEEGKTYGVKNNDGTMKMVRVVKINETTAVLDENNPLAGKVLYFNITLKNILS